MGAPSSKLCDCLAASSVAVTLLSVLAATAGAATAQELLIDQPVPRASDPQQREPAKQADNPPERAVSEATASRFDAATLPPIETINAQTDITLFLRSAVPNELRLAALRRAWTVDPTIRESRGVQENDWNFNDPGSIPGFGELGPGVDVKRMVAEILGEAPRMAFAARRTK